MDLLQLRYFYKIAHAPTLTQAAAELHISQPSLSKIIRNLEDEFQVKLFTRNGRYLQLNEKGQIFLRHTTAILNAVDDLREELQGYREREDLSLRVGVFAASALFPDIISGFRQAYPNVKINMVQHSFEHAKQKTSLDLMILAGRYPPVDPNCVLLAQEDILLAVPGNHPLAGRESVPLAQLKGEKFISMSKGMTLRTIVDQYCQSAGIQPNVVLESDDPAMLRNLIQSGFGVAFVPEKTWTAYIRGNLHMLHITDPHCVRYLYLSTPRGSYQSTAAKLFQRYLVWFFSEHGPFQAPQSKVAGMKSEMAGDLMPELVKWGQL